ncbi:CD209 antigen-like protein D isoform X1 [Clarias gariepinus]|uniref:CD209 antigen-like protein D isoform X1 n=1 Tax=Clarias gariepinus TaxID=13013 RepID=UPI00234DD1B1|nr:CD209 antigen-like protein D isoform X1 [Clarias gariepinus]
MDPQKTTEVEMAELTSAKEKDNTDAEKNKVEGTKEPENKEEKKEKEIKSEGNLYSTLNAPTEDVDKDSKTTSSPKGSEEAQKKAEGKEKDIKDEKTNVYSKLKTPTEDVYNVSKPSSSSKRKEEENVKEEDEETDLYCKLNIPSENVYMSAGTNSRDKEDVYRKLQLYRRISVFFLVLTLLLLAVVLGLAMKLSETKSIPKCPDHPSDHKKPIYPVSQGYQCSECRKDWIRVNTSCYFFSKERQNWHESREACQKQGGDLVVIDNENSQVFQSYARGLLYWIGLHYSENKWMWVNNTTLTKSYWNPRYPNPVTQGNCALLKGHLPYMTNWIVNPCYLSSHYICQKRLKVEG